MPSFARQQHRPPLYITLEVDRNCWVGLDRQSHMQGWAPLTLPSNETSPLLLHTACMYFTGRSRGLSPPSKLLSKYVMKKMITYDSFP